MVFKWTNRAAKMIFQFGICFVVFVCCFIPGTEETNKTPRSIEFIFKARCLEYQEVMHPNTFYNNSKDCASLWKLFFDAFAYKEPCNVKPEDYSSFISAADHNVQTQDRVMYWSGDVYPFVIQYASYSNQFTTIRDQLSVYVLDKIEYWCGQIQHPGINFKECPQWGSCTESATISFWKEMSKHFASKIRGTVHVMLNGSSPVAYRRSGIFAQSELAKLKKEITPELHVHLISLLDNPPVESCSNGSLLLLKEDVEQKGMRFKCSEKELNIMYFQCVTQPDAKKCRKFVSSAAVSKFSILMLISMMFCIVGSTY